MLAKSLRITLVLVVIMVSTVLNVPAHAQESRLPGYALQLLDRLIEAQQRLDTYDSYTMDGSGELAQSVTVVLGLSSQVAARSTGWEQHVTVVQDSAPNIRSDVSATVTFRDVDMQRQETISSFGLDGEVRLVDDTLYVSADVTQPGPDAPELPEGWVAVQTPDAFAQYADLRLHDLTAQDLPLEDRQRVIAAAENIALEQVTLADGTQADRITADFNRDGLAMLLWSEGDTIDPLMRAILDATGSGFRARLAVTLDSRNNPLAVETDLYMEAVGVDGYTLMPDQIPSGVMLDLTFSLHDAKTYSDVNAPLEPVMAPIQ